MLHWLQKHRVHNDNCGDDPHGGSLPLHRIIGKNQYHLYGSDAAIRKRSLPALG